MTIPDVPVLLGGAAAAAALMLYRLAVRAWNLYWHNRPLVEEWATPQVTYCRYGRVGQPWRLVYLAECETCGAWWNRRSRRAMLRTVDAHTCPADTEGP